MMVKSRTFIATPPGATIKEQLLDKGMSQKEFATRMDLSQKHVSKLINGEVQLTPDVAVRLEMVLGIPAKFWNKLEATYREKLIKANAENEMDADIEIARKMPYNEMVKYGWVPVAKKIEEKVINLRKFFGVVSLVLLKDMRLSRIACRRLADTEKSNYAKYDYSRSRCFLYTARKSACRMWYCSYFSSSYWRFVLTWCNFC